MEKLRVISCIFFVVVATGRVIPDDYGRLEEGPESRDDYTPKEQGSRVEDFDISAEQVQDYARTTIRELIPKYVRRDDAKNDTETLSKILNNSDNNDDEKAKVKDDTDYEIKKDPAPIEEMKIAPVAPAKNVEKKDVRVSMEKPEEKQGAPLEKKKDLPAPMQIVVAKDASVTIEKVDEKHDAPVKDVPVMKTEEKKGVASPTMNKADIAAPDDDDDVDVDAPTSEAHNDDDVAAPSTSEAGDGDDVAAAPTYDDDFNDPETYEDFSDPVTFDEDFAHPVTFDDDFADFVSSDDDFADPETYEDDFADPETYEDDFADPETYDDDVADHVTKTDTDHEIKKDPAPVITTVEKMKIAPVAPEKDVEKKDVSMEKPEEKQGTTPLDKRKDSPAPMQKVVAKDASVPVEKVEEKHGAPVKDVPVMKAEDTKGVAAPTTNKADVAAPTMNGADDDDVAALTSEAGDDDVAGPTSEADADADATLTMLPLLSEAGDDDFTDPVTYDDFADPVTYDDDFADPGTYDVHDLKEEQNSFLRFLR